MNNCQKELIILIDDFELDTGLDNDLLYSDRCFEEQYAVVDTYFWVYYSDEQKKEFKNCNNLFVTILRFYDIDIEQIKYRILFYDICGNYYNTSFKSFERLYDFLYYQFLKD